MTVGRFLGPAGGVAGLTFWKLAGRLQPDSRIVDELTGKVEGSKVAACRPT
jgi:hypothetical protein